MTLSEAKQKAINEIAACKHATFQIWKVGNIFFMQEYVLNGKKKEFYGHTFRIDFDNKTLTPVI